MYILANPTTVIPSKNERKIYLTISDPICLTNWSAHHLSVHIARLENRLMETLHCFSYKSM